MENQLLSSGGQVVGDLPFSSSTLRTELPLAFTTMGELGMNLPIGSPQSDGNRARSFVLRDFTFDHEQKIADIKENARGITVSSFVAEVLALMVKSVSGISLDEMSDSEKKLLLAGLPAGDVFYMYAALRRVTLGREIGLKLTCGNCRSEFSFEGDLDGLDVLMVEDGHPDLAELSWYVQLRDGLDLKGQRVDGLWLSEIRWGAMATVSGGVTAGARKGELLRQRIVDTSPSVRVKGTPLAITDTDIKRLSKYDYEAISASVEDNSPGPHLTIDVTCPSCKYEMVHSIDWTYDSFFTLSRRQPRRRKR